MSPWIIQSFHHSLTYGRNSPGHIFGPPNLSWSQSGLLEAHLKHFLVRFPATPPRYQSSTCCWWRNKLWQDWSWVRTASRGRWPSFPLPRQKSPYWALRSFLEGVDWICLGHRSDEFWKFQCHAWSCHWWDTWSGLTFRQKCCRWPWFWCDSCFGPR